MPFGRVVQVVEVATRGPTRGLALCNKAEVRLPPGDVDYATTRHLPAGRLAVVVDDRPHPLVVTDRRVDRARVVDEERLVGFELGVSVNGDRDRLARHPRQEGHRPRGCYVFSFGHRRRPVPTRIPYPTLFRSGLALCNKAEVRLPPGDVDYATTRHLPAGRLAVVVDDRPHPLVVTD